VTAAAPNGAPVIVPTHTCFDDALDWFDQVMSPERVTVEMLDTFCVAHGVLHAEGGVPYAHAWVEQSACGTFYVAGPDEYPVPPVLAWQAGIVNEQRVYFGIERDVFYRTYRVQRATIYSFGKAMALNRTSGHYGPWEPEYVALCRRHGEEGRVLGIVSGAAPSILIVIGANKSISIHGRPRS
jgi:hypothetical protein